MSVVKKTIGELVSTGQVKRVIGSRIHASDTVPNLSQAEIDEVLGVEVERDSECSWFAKLTGCKWLSLLVVLH